LSEGSKKETEFQGKRIKHMTHSQKEPRLIEKEEERGRGENNPERKLLVV